ncbi:phosphodiester glycosidase family protein [Sandaracinus amylolyticus]|uniref:phosphodiester glycosidase family protein n=1 Tax=Sandaracinus amylolyticus TaxID=927083 RepID=UPI001F1B7B69|nr:phosphodiester glycosidase family protein [Sandaracinus amylolyticus]UJR83496.1 Hypothetical protein I5071_55640 [Sandaracinus amylolyticus]
MRASCVALVAFLSLALPAHAQEVPRRAAESRDVWSEPNPGVRYLFRTTTTPTELHALVVSLAHPGVRIVATRYDDRWTTVGDHARTHGLAGAINGGFWGALQRPRGLAIGGGVAWPTSAPDPEMGFFAIDARGRALVRAPGEAVADDELASLGDAVSGRPILVRAGAIDRSALDAFETANQRQPRTAIGLSEDRRTAVLVVVDGRRPTSRGMTLYELARSMIELGAHDAINLDGGGSSEMYVARAGGVVNVPSRGRWELALGAATEEVRRDASGREERYVRGVEREVLNHVGVIAPEWPALAPTAFASGLAGAPEIDAPSTHRGEQPATRPTRRLAPEPPSLRLGVLRESVPFAVALLGLVVVVIVIARRRRGAAPLARSRGAPIANSQR